MPDYSHVPLVQKLGIKEGTRLYTLNAPGNFRGLLGDLPLAVEWANRLRAPLDIVVAFHTQRSGIAASFPKLADTVGLDGAIWVCWPKKASGVETDITDAVVREEILRSGWVDNKVCAIDEIWTALRFVGRKADRKKRSGGPNKPAKLVRRKPGAHR